MAQKMPKKKKVDIDYVNEQAQSNLQRLVKQSEERYRQQVLRTAQNIADHIQDYKIILIAGPSASGKTTTSLTLRRTLYSLGVKSIAIALDDFFLDRDQLPLMENGDKDYESVHALDIESVRNCFSELLEKRQSHIPIFNFEEGGRTGYKKIRISNEHVVIVEGIHGLNPLIFPKGHDEGFYRIYISVRSEYENSNGILLNSRTVRQMRRLIRDFNFRGSPLENTFSMWNNVLKGEEIFIDPFRDGANVWIDSLHLYEPLIYKEKLLPMLDNIPQDSLYWNDIQKLKNILEHFAPVHIPAIPHDSMLHEFLL